MLAVFNVFREKPVRYNNKGLLPLGFVSRHGSWIRTKMTTESTGFGVTRQMYNSVPLRGVLRRFRAIHLDLLVLQVNELLKYTMILVIPV